MRAFPCVPAGVRQRGPFSRVREWPPLDPPRERKGRAPRPRTLAVFILKNCTRCALHSRWQLCCLTDVAYPLRVVGCGVHGFAMDLLRIVTDINRALLHCREARVTFSRRQTACRMRHRCARRLFCGAMRGTFHSPPANRRSARRFS